MASGCCQVSQANDRHASRCRSASRVAVGKRAQASTAAGDRQVLPCVASGCCQVSQANDRHASRCQCEPSGCRQASPGEHRCRRQAGAAVRGEQVLPSEPSERSACKPMPQCEPSGCRQASPGEHRCRRQAGAAVRGERVLPSEPSERSACKPMPQCKPSGRQQASPGEQPLPETG